MSSLAAAKRATWAFIGGALPRDGGDDPNTAAILDAAPAGNFMRHLLPALLARTDRHDSAQRVAQVIALLREGGIARLPTALAHLPVRALAAQVFVQAEDVRNAVDSVQALARVLDIDRPASLRELLRVIRAQEEVREAAAASGAGSGLVLSTIEQAKGLEYDHVIIPGLGRGEFDERGDGDDADERNRYYVAVSRARETVELVHGGGPVSRFLAG